MDKSNAPVEYGTAEIFDYGDVVDLTASAAKGSVTDVPKGTPGPNVFT